MFDDSTPIFMQLADQLCAEIVAGTYPDGAKAPSINELAVFHRINPATANRAIALLVERGVLIKRRGIGMFVADGARLHLMPIAEAATLGISGRELIALIQKEVNP